MSAVPLAVESFVNEQVNPSPIRGMPTYLRMTPPGEPESRIETPLSATEASCITVIVEKRRKRYGAFLTECVSELPDDIRYRKAIPRIIRELFDLMERERISWEELCKTSRLDFGAWKAEMV